MAEPDPASDFVPPFVIPHLASQDGLSGNARIVWDFLTLFAARRYAEANHFLAPGAVMTFPGGGMFSDCEELPKRSSGRYRWVAKCFERFDEMPSGDSTAVYCFGTLYGEWPDGRPFRDIRYIDRFEIREGKISDQKVWNDVALHIGSV